MLSDWKRSNAIFTNRIMGLLNNAPGLLKQVASFIPVANIAFRTAEYHKTAVQLLAEKAYSDGKLSPKARTAWREYMRTVEQEHKSYDKFCMTFLEHLHETKKNK
jgi:hypothetical protein